MSLCRCLGVLWSPWTPLWAWKRQSKLLGGRGQSPLQLYLPQFRESENHFDHKRPQRSLNPSVNPALSTTKPCPYIYIYTSLKYLQEWSFWAACSSAWKPVGEEIIPNSRSKLSLEFPFFSLERWLSVVCQTWYSDILQFPPDLWSRISFCFTGWWSCWQTGLRLYLPGIVRLGMSLWLLSTWGTHYP